MKRQFHIICFSFILFLYMLTSNAVGGANFGFYGGYAHGEKYHHKLGTFTLYFNLGSYIEFNPISFIGIQFELNYQQGMMERWFSVHQSVKDRTEPFNLLHSSFNGLFYLNQFQARKPQKIKLFAQAGVGLRWNDGVPYLKYGGGFKFPLGHSAPKHVVLSFAYYRTLKRHALILPYYSFNIGLEI